MKFGQSMDVDDLKVSLDGQGHQVKKPDFRAHFTGLQVILKIKGHMGQGQRPRGARSKVTSQGQPKGQRSWSPG